jgi:hypothetical protein
VPESAWLTVSFLVSVAGTGWLALALDRHWRQVRETESPRAATRRRLRVLGGAALMTSLLVCFLANHASMAPLVWCMELAAAAFLVAMLLAWRPRWLVVLAPRALL